MNLKPLLAEAIGTFTLIFVGVGAIAANYTTEGALGLTGIALAHGLAIAVMVSATAAISGGHLNPAVTLGLLAGGKIDGARALLYIVAQCVGAVLAAVLIGACVQSESLVETGFGIPAPGRGVSASAVIAMEAVLTFFLVFVVYGTAVDARAPKVGGLFIGLTVALDILCGGPVSGGAMNPARHLGPALAFGQLSNIWLYWVGPILGGIIAGLVYSKGIEGR
jgi:MIP family channel proteins